MTFGPSAPPPSAGPKVFWRPLIGQPWITGAIVLAVAMSAFGVSATPRLLDEVSARDLEATLTEPEPEVRNLRVERLTKISGGREEVFERIEELGDQFLEDVTPTVRDAIGRHLYVIDTPQMIIDPLPGEEARPFDLSMRFRFQEELDGEIELVEGRMPRASEPVELWLGDECPSDADELEDFEPAEDVDCILVEVPVYEVVLSASAAEDLIMDVGDEVLLRPDPNDVLYRLNLGTENLSKRIVARLVGIIGLSDLEGEFWFGDNTLHQARIVENPDFRFVDATALTHESNYRSAIGEMGNPDFRYTWRYFISPERVNIDNAAQLAFDLRQIDTDLPAASLAFDHLDLITGLPGLIDEYFSQRTQAIALLSVGVVGLIVTTSLLVSLLSGLMAMRERPSLVLVRNRGSSRPQLLMTKAYQGLVLSVPAALLGYYLAWLVFPDSGDDVPTNATVALVVGVLGAVVIASAPIIGRRLGALQRSDAGTPRSSSARRIVVEAVIVLMGIGAVLLVRRRSQIESPASDAQFDLLLAATPALLGLAVAVLALRLIDPVVRAARWLVARGRAFAAYLGLTQVMQSRGAARVPILVIVVAVTLSIFSTFAQNTIDEGQVLTSYQTVGADYLVKTQAAGLAFTASADLSDVVGIEVVAGAAEFPDTRADTSFSVRRVTTLAIDTDRHREVLDGVQGVPRIPDLKPAVAGVPLGTPENPLPILVTTAWPREDRPPLGEVFQISIGGNRPWVTPVEHIESFPGRPPRAPLIVVDLESMKETSPIPIRESLLFIRASRAAGPALLETITDQVSNARIDSRYEFFDSVARDPFIDWSRTALTLVQVTSAIFAAVTAAASAVIAAAARRRDHAYLRTLGTDLGQVQRISIIEQVPLLSIALVMGLVAGVAGGLAVGSALSLDGFTGGLVPAEQTVNWLAISVTVGVIALTMAVGTVSFFLVSGRRSPSQVIRVGDEQ